MSRGKAKETSKARGFEGMWVGERGNGTLFIPDNQDAPWLLAVDKQGYDLNIAACDLTNGCAQGIVTCHQNGHQVGRWKAEPSPSNPNRFRIHIWFNNGVETDFTIRRTE
jgi:hypothetical protein